MVHHAVSPECEHPAALTAPEGHVAIVGEEKEGKLQFCKYCLYKGKSLAPVGFEALCAVIWSDGAKEKKSRKQDANRNIPAEILTPELPSLKTTCLEQNLCSGWSSCSERWFQTISVVKKP